MRTVGLVERPAVAETPAAGLKKADITAKLDALGVEYNPKAKKDVLLQLLKEAEEEQDEAVPEPEAEADIEPDKE